MSKHNPVVKYLRQIMELRIKMAKPSGYYYSNLEHFFFEAGRDMEWGPLPKCVKPMKIGYCFNNAFKLAQDEGYAYVEGYACGIIPVHHAWNIGHDGKVIDVTWAGRYTDENSAYYGVEIPFAVVVDQLLQKRTYGVVDNWEADWPLLKDKWPY